MEALRKFFQIPLIRFSVHIILISGLTINIYNLYNWYSINSQVTKNYNILSELKYQNIDSQNKQGYYNTDLYKEKYAKTTGFKNKNEYVVDTSLVETSELTQPNFIPERQSNTLTNPDKWFVCFFGNTDIDLVKKSTTEKLNSNCKN